MKQPFHQNLGASLAMMAALAVPAIGMAKPATPTLLTYTQPDGSQIEVRKYGDENHHFYATPEGQQLALDPSGFLVPASQLPAALDAEETPEQKKYIISGAPFPSEGEPHALVVLVEFKNRSFSISNPKEFYTRLLNEEGFSDYSATGSARDFFIENSGEKFRPVFDVYGPITLRDNMAYYGSNDMYGYDMHPEEMCIEACTQLDEEIDFTQYDLNGDGYIDNIYIYYAGYGEADSTYAYTIWPHSANMTDFDLGKTYTFDGMILDRYAMSNELDYSYGRPDGVGTFVHEFSHVLGIPDFYATNYSTAFTPDSFSTLDMGPYNNQGRTPPYYSIFERMSLGWANPTRATEGENSITLEPVNISNDGLLIPTEYENEFYLLENRQKSGWDAYLPGHGMLVWHIDFNQLIWDRNIVNNTSYHQYVDIVEADNIRSNLTRSGDPFPGTKNITEFTSSTTPALTSWAGKDLYCALTNIAEDTNAGLITFDLSYNPPASVATLPQAPKCEWLSIEGGSLRNTTDTETIQLYDASGCKIATLLPGDAAEVATGSVVIAVKGAETHKLILH